MWFFYGVMRCYCLPPDATCDEEDTPGFNLYKLEGNLVFDVWINNLDIDVVIKDDGAATTTAVQRTTTLEATTTSPPALATAQNGEDEQAAIAAIAGSVGIGIVLFGACLGCQLLAKKYGVRQAGGENALPARDQAPAAPAAPAAEAVGMPTVTDRSTEELDNNLPQPAADQEEGQQEPPQVPTPWVPPPCSDNEAVHNEAVMVDSIEPAVLGCASSRIESL